MKKLILIILPVLLIGLVACESTLIGSEHIVSENRDVSGVTAVRLMTSGDLTIEQGAQESLTIEADDNLLPELTSDVVGGTLELSMHSPGISNLHNPIRYHLVVKKINGLTLMGSGDITAAALNGDTVTITSMGSGDIKIAQLTAKSLNVVIDGSGDVNASAGTANDANVHANGSGNFTAGNLQIGKAAFSVLGSGDSETWVTNELNVNTLGSGDVRYFGKPTIQQSTLGSGDIISLGNK